jgi:hypothetical protein
MPLMLAFVLGLGLPRSFFLLYCIEAACVLFAWQKKKIAPTPLLLFSTITLLGFGVSYVVFRLSWGVWVPIIDHVQQVLAAALLPGFGLMAGWCLQRIGGSMLSRKAISMMIIAYGFGALLYVLISLGLTHSTWSDWFQQLSQNVVVPWGSEHPLNMRSVEQRAYVSLACLPAAFLLLSSHQLRYRLMALVLFIACLLASLATWSFQSRIGWCVLLLSTLPWICSPKIMPKRAFTLPLVLASLVFVGVSGRFCDERFSLQTHFLANVWQAPWGGRLIRFNYGDCNPVITNHFGSFWGSNASSPHNVLLDIYNDAGVLPSFLMLASISMMVISILGWFILRFRLDVWDWHLAVRWAMFSVLAVQFFAQPFMYSDQLMFSVGFIYAGIMMGEAFADKQYYCSSRDVKYLDK